MRSEQDMMALILDTARQDDRIRAVIMNGSRTNPNVKKDIFQDFDIIYVVKENNSFTRDHSWVARFGERIMMQMPEDKALPSPLDDGRFIYLMWFKDGNRIDLTLIPVEKMDDLMELDSLSECLLDKDGIIGELPPSSDKDYFIKRPTDRQFADSCNEFWWITLNIAKGLWREELTYTMFMKEQINRDVLMRMIEWRIGIQTDFSVSAGKLGKRFNEFLTGQEWQAFEATYTDGHIDHILDGVFKMCELFRDMAKQVAEHFNFTYPHEDDKNTMEFIKRVKALPKTATDM